MVKSKRDVKEETEERCMITFEMICRIPANSSPHVFYDVPCCPHISRTPSFPSYPKFAPSSVAEIKHEAIDTYEEEAQVHVTTNTQGRERPTLKKSRKKEVGNGYSHPESPSSRERERDAAHIYSSSTYLSHQGPNVARQRGCIQLDNATEPEKSNDNYSESHRSPKRELYGSRRDSSSTHHIETGRSNRENDAGRNGPRPRVYNELDKAIALRNRASTSQNDNKSEQRQTSDHREDRERLRDGEPRRTDSSRDMRRVVHERERRPEYEERRHSDADRERRPRERGASMDRENSSRRLLESGRRSGGHHDRRGRRREAERNRNRRIFEKERHIRKSLHTSSHLKTSFDQAREIDEGDQENSRWSRRDKENSSTSPHSGSKTEKRNSKSQKRKERQAEKDNGRPGSSYMDFGYMDLGYDGTLVDRVHADTQDDQLHQGIRVRVSEQALYMSDLPPRGKIDEDVSEEIASMNRKLEGVQVQIQTSLVQQTTDGQESPKDRRAETWAKNTPKVKSVAKRVFLRYFKLKVINKDTYKFFMRECVKFCLTFNVVHTADIVKKANEILRDAGLRCE